MSEAEHDVAEYATLQAFFTRRLRDGARVVARGGVASPADGRVLHFGALARDGTLEQIKGSAFALARFIGPHVLADAAARDSQLYFCTVYLSPGDYHGVHAPVAMALDGRRHFPGLALPVAPFVVGALRGLFAENERVVLFGRWRHGFMSVTPVG